MPASPDETAAPMSTNTSHELAMHADSASGLLKCLANPKRLMILCALAEGELSVSALNRRIALSQSALSQHLAVLRTEGLVHTRRDARTIHYRIAPGPALDIIQVLHHHFCCTSTT